MTTRDDVLAALRDADGEPVSGESLARELGVSRVAVGKHVSALRDAGYGIEALAGAGYRLVSAPDAPLPVEVAALLQTALWVDLRGGGATGSTNDDARTLARAGAPEGTAVLASEQTGGRGRLGRTWSSPPGGVYLSVVLRPVVAPAQVASLALAVALGVARGFDRLGADAALKWPNDVLLGERKLAGVLLEMGAEPDRVEWVVAGIGVNVRRPAENPALAPGGLEPVYLSDALTAPLLAPVAAALLDGVAEAYAEWTAHGFSAMREEYERRHRLVGRHVAVRDLAGTVHAEGVVAGVDDEGRLLVRDAGGDVTPVTAGEVSLRG